MGFDIYAIFAHTIAWQNSTNLFEYIQEKHYIKSKEKSMYFREMMVKKAHFHPLLIQTTNAQQLVSSCTQEWK